MEISIIINSSHYLRVIESMGRGLVLFKVRAKNKRLGQNFHYFFENKRKPPLDLAINPQTKLVEYISFFVQDEVIMKNEIASEIIFLSKNIAFTCNEFSSNNTEKTEEMEFLMTFSENNLYVVDKSYQQKLFGYQINKENYMLFDEDNFFRGCVLKNITGSEINEIIKSQYL